MPFSGGGGDDEVAALRDLALMVYREAASDPVTAPAAFGIAALTIQQKLKISTLVACWILERWLQEAQL